MRLFPGAIFVLIGLNVCIVAVTSYFAHSSGAAAPEPDYYQRALRWDEVKREKARERLLGWQVELRVDDEPAAGRGRRVEVHVRDAAGADLRGASVMLTAFHNARASRPVTLGLSPADGGRYSVVAPLAPHGLWEFRVRIVRGPDQFGLARQVMIGPASGEAAR